MSIVPCQRARLQSQAGFTLVELAIVMIIIGLLIGGVLKGQQLITNAQVAATVAQIKSIDAATTSFKDQYAGIPGDLVTPATRLPNCLLNCAIAGNGDGKVDTAAGVAINFGAVPGGEQLAFWAQLNKAGLLTGINPPNAVGVGAPSTWGGYAPASKINGGGFDVGWYGGGVAFPSQSAGAVGLNVLSGHYLALHGQPGVAMSATVADGFMTSNIAARIDTKIDDGVPNSGSVLAGGVAACTLAGPPATYNEAATGAQCSLYIQFQN
jgi:prepilin-type N-terminal cleavage/methylation domain-containing protein